MEKQIPRLSIIMPVYNVEGYIRKTLDSILNQKFTDFELIAVDDGSKDNSGEILDEYAEKDNRIKVIHIPNGGVSNARNVALESASGKYIGFVDADDEVDEYMYEKLLKETEIDENLDMVQCQYLNVYENKPFKKGGKKDKTLLLEGSEQISLGFFNEKTHLIHWSLWTKIFKHNTIRNIKFNVDYAIAEDTLFVFECMIKMNKIKIIDDIGYYYLQRESSAIHQKFGVKNFGVINIIDVYKRHYNKTEPICSLIERYEARACVKILLGIMREDNNFAKEFDQIRSRLLKLKCKVFLGKTIEGKVKIITFLLWLSPTLCKKLYRWSISSR